ncbi:UNVERIFIED_CONTAM: hypothetical protein K2H54_043979 [Gekko kuhli]
MGSLGRMWKYFHAADCSHAPMPINGALYRHNHFPDSDPGLIVGGVLTVEGQAGYRSRESPGMEQDETLWQSSPISPLAMAVSSLSRVLCPRSPSGASGSSRPVTKTSPVNTAGEPDAEATDDVPKQDGTGVGERGHIPPPVASVTCLPICPCP